MRIVLVLCALVLLSPAQAADQRAQLVAVTPEYGGVIARLKREITRTMAREDVIGASIALIDDQQLVWAEGFGLANARSKTPARADTIYQAGDLSKIVTTIAALQLVQRGVLTLDATLDRLLPELTIDSRFADQPPLTLRQLLSHHAGLPTAQWAGSYQRTPAVALNAVETVHVSQPTGQIYAYSNLAFELVGHIIERYSGQHFVDRVRTSLLEPLGMVDSGFGPVAEQRLAIGHDKRRVRPPTYPRDVASLGLLTSVTDGARLVQWLLREQTAPLLDRRWLDIMQQSQNDSVTLDLDNRTGLGWQLTNTGRHGVDKVLRINASTLDHRGIVLIAPNEKVGVVLFSNSSSATDFVIDISRRALDELLHAKYGVPIVDFDDDVPARVPQRHGGNDTLQRAYSTALGLIEFDGGPRRASMRFLGRRFSAKQRDDGWYEIRYRLLGIVPLRLGILRDVLLRPSRLPSADGEQQVLLVFYQNQVFLLGTRLPQPAPDNAQQDALRQLTGDYRLVNPDPLAERLKIDRVRVEYQDGRLIASYRLPIMFSLRLRMPLEPIGGDRYLVPGLGTNLGDEVSIARAEQRTILQYSGYRFARKSP